MKSEAGKGLEGVKMETNEKRNVPDDDVIVLREIFFAIKRKIFLIIAVGLLWKYIQDLLKKPYMRHTDSHPAILLQ